MTPQEINIAIAEECGWTMIATNHKDALMGFAPLIPEMDDCQWLPLPNYHGDLNAMHEAEMTLLTGDQQQIVWEYSSLLRSGWQWHATCAQRAEAFLKVKGKWKE
jgi:hypothetical protein